MKNKKSKPEIALALLAIALLFSGLVSLVYNLMHGGLS
jgi:hypothetical protein